jgi:hypothetical protein
VVVVPDCENHTAAVENSLRFVGLLGKKGKLKTKIAGAHLVQIGDLLHKNAPDPGVVRFWNRLQAHAEPAGCSMHFVAGNHELEIWRRLQAGERLGLKRREQREMRTFIRGTKLFHLEGSMLFIHGYPTIKLLRHIQAYMVRTGKTLDNYNRDCFRPALEEIKLLARYSYPRRHACRGCLLHDLVNPERYYRRYGREIAGLLRWLGIDTVVHGHRPERSGEQRDYELGNLLPGIRMISTDIQLRTQGMGVTLIRQMEKGPTDLLFINRGSATSATRSAAKQMLRAPNCLAGRLAKRKKSGSVTRISGLFRGRHLRIKKRIAATRAASA